MPFGQKFCAEPDTGDTLFNRVAQEIKTDMRNHWRPDTDFLGRRNRAQCIEIAKECGFSDGASILGGFKKSELVNGLLKYFSHAGQAKKPTKPQKKALNWLPAVMQFPAIKPEEEPTA